MKTLYVVRHAKSSWDAPGLDDFDRPLNERGKKDAPRMGKRLSKKQIRPDLLLSSPAKRAWSTCKRIAEELHYPEKKIVTETNLYHADEEEIFSVIQKVDDKHNTLMIFGHNPGLTDFVNALSEEKIEIDIIPTCGIVSFSLKIDSWTKISNGIGEVNFFDYPKRIND
jgi:phosphohistidine phosphatase